MSGPLADPALSALILWFVLPAALLAGGACLALWRGRRDWVVVEAVVRSRPDPDDPAAETEIAWRDHAGEVRVARLRLPLPKGPPPAGALLSFSHPPGRPEALQLGTPRPLLGGAIACGLVAALGVAILLGV